jgi:DNA repair protein RecO (recombination protein O)
MLAFTLSRRDYREYDQFVTFYTKEQGKVETVARGIKRSISKNAPALEPFSLVDIEVVPGKNASYVTKAVPYEVFKEVREEPAKILLAGYIVRVVECSVGIGAGESSIFKLLYSAFQYLDSTKKISAYFAPAFLFRLSTFLGFTPVLSGCSACGKKKLKKIGFDPAGGGFVCEECALKGKNKIIPLTVQEVQTLRSLLKKTWVTLPQQDKSFEKISNMVTLYAEYHLGFKLTDPAQFVRFGAKGFANFSPEDYNPSIK